MWFRRDLRLGDNPALLEAGADGRCCPCSSSTPPSGVRPGRPGGPTSAPRSAALDGQLRQRRTRLSVVRGDPVASRRAGRQGGRRRAGARRGGLRAVRRRSATRGREALGDAGIELVRTGSPYAVAPGPGPQRVRRPVQGVHAVLAGVGRARLARPGGPAERRLLAGARGRHHRHPRAGGAGRARAARGGRGRGAAALARSSSPDVGDYDDLATTPAATRPRGCRCTSSTARSTRATMLADLAALRERRRGDVPQGAGLARVLRRRPPREPGTAHATTCGPSTRGCRTTSPAAGSRPGSAVAPASRSSTPGCASCGRTGWMHNRVRMIVASFLVKDLHLEWQHGARHFMRWLVDGDLASNQHGWQWTAGCGHRRGAVLPGLQPHRAEPEVRPAPATTSGAGSRSSPTPTRCPTRTSRTTDTPQVGYPRPIVDHARGAPRGPRPLGADPVR